MQATSSQNRNDTIVDKEDLNMVAIIKSENNNDDSENGNENENENENVNTNVNTNGNANGNEHESNNRNHNDIATNGYGPTRDGAHTMYCQS